MNTKRLRKMDNFLYYNFKSDFNAEVPRDIIIFPDKHPIEVYATDGYGKFSLALINDLDDAKGYAKYLLRKYKKLLTNRRVKWKTLP